MADLRTDAQASIGRVAIAAPANHRTTFIRYVVGGVFCLVAPSFLGRIIRTDDRWVTRRRYRMNKTTTFSRPTPQMPFLTALAKSFREI